MSKAGNIIAWIFQLLMGTLYIIESFGKVISHPEVVQNFENWGYPFGFYLIIGVVELVCGFLLFGPKTAGYACVVLFFVMIAAALTHIVHDEGLIVLRPIAYAAGLGIVFYFRFILDMKNDDQEFLPLNNVS